MPEAVYDLLREAARGRIGVDRRLISSIVEHGDAAVPDVLRFGLEERGDDAIALDLDLVNIFRIIRTPKAVDYYIKLIRLQPHEIEDELVEGLVEIGAPSIEPLLKLYEELGEDEGGEVAFLLASLRIRDDRIKKLLVDRLEFDAWDGAVCLGLYGDPETRTHIESILNGIAENEDNKSLRRDLEQAIDELNTTVEALTAQAPAEILELYPERALPEFDVLTVAERLQLLASDDVEVRINAADSLGGQELGNRERDELFRVAAGDEDARVRAAGWRGLADVAAEHTEIANQMLARAADANVPKVERGGALVGLAHAVEVAKMRPLALELYEDPETRAAALDAMRRTFDKSFVAYFPKHLDDADPAVRREAIWGTGYLQIGDQAENLRRFFDTEEYRSDALFAYALCVRGESSPSRMKALLKKIDVAAGGLSEFEEELVKTALDERLVMHGEEPMFLSEEEDTEPVAPAVSVKIGRNDPCPCGSGKKYKKCCGA